MPDALIYPSSPSWRQLLRTRPRLMSSRSSAWRGRILVLTFFCVAFVAFALLASVLFASDLDRRSGPNENGRQRLPETSLVTKEIAKLREVNKQLEKQLEQEDGIRGIVREKQLKEQQSRYDSQFAHQTEALIQMYERELEKQKAFLHERWASQNASLAKTYRELLKRQSTQKKLRGEMTKEIGENLYTSLKPIQVAEIQIDPDKPWTAETSQDVQTDLFSTPPVKFGFKRFKAINLDEIEARQNWTSAQWEAAALKTFAANRQKINGYVILCLANSGMKELVMNMIASLIRNKYTRFVILCYDFALYRFLCEHGFMQNAVMVPSEWAKMTVASGPVGWKDSAYYAMLVAKMKILLEVLKIGISIFHIDADLVFLSPNVLQSLWLEYGEATEMMPEFIFQCDRSKEHPMVINGGLWLGRSTPTVLRLFNLTIQKLSANPGMLDQVAMNSVAHKVLALTKDPQVASGLSPLLFPSGWMVFMTNHTKRVGVYPMVFHANFLVGNAKKKSALQSMNMWYIGEDFA